MSAQKVKNLLPFTPKGSRQANAFLLEYTSFMKHIHLLYSKFTFLILGVSPLDGSCSQQQVYTSQDCKWRASHLMLSVTARPFKAVRGGRPTSASVDYKCTRQALFLARNQSELHDQLTNQSYFGWLVHQSDFGWVDTGCLILLW